MKTSIRNSLKPLQVLVGALIVTQAPLMCRAQEPQVTAPVAPQPQDAPLLDEGALHDEKSLQAPVTFEAKRQKLPDVLAALQVQSGVALSVAPNSPLTSKLLTARAKSMPLAKVLSSLSRLYGAGWARQDKGFELRSNGRSLLENAMWKLWYTKYNFNNDMQANPVDWEEEMGALGVNRLQQKGGVPFEELSEDSAQKIRTQIEGQEVPELGLAMDGARLSNLAGSKVEITDESTPEGSKVSIRFFTPDGKLVSQRTTDVTTDAK